MAYQTIFKRYEIKYLITREQQKRIKTAIIPFMKPDEYGKSTIYSLYFDTPNHLLIRRSLEKPAYKEKLRLRSYGQARPDSTVFIEIKKKYQSVVYKRRVSVSEENARAYFEKNRPLPTQNQITAEIDYFFQQYPGLCPAVFLSYEREAFYAKDGIDFRLTFDENILWREDSLSLCAGTFGNRVLPGDFDGDENRFCSSSLDGAPAQLRADLSHFVFQIRERLPTNITAAAGRRRTLCLTEFLRDYLTLRQLRR